MVAQPGLASPLRADRGGRLCTAMARSAYERMAAPSTDDPPSFRAISSKMAIDIDPSRTGAARCRINIDSIAAPQASSGLLSVGIHDYRGAERLTSSAFVISTEQNVAKEAPLAGRTSLFPASLPEMPSNIIQFKVWLLVLSSMV